MLRNMNVKFYTPSGYDAVYHTRGRDLLPKVIIYNVWNLQT